MTQPEESEAIRVARETFDTAAKHLAETRLEEWRARIGMCSPDYISKTLMEHDVASVEFNAAAVKLARLLEGVES